MRRREWIGVGFAALAAVGACAVGVSGAGAQYPEPSAPRPNPCLGELAKELRCPDLRMAPPAEMYVSRGGGKVLLHAQNNIQSRGEGPMEVRGRRTSRRYMDVRQVIHKAGGGARSFATDGHLVFYFIPGQGSYWKFQGAAQFELWSTNPDGSRGALVRVGPKLNYCFRDLKRTRPSGRSPRHRVYPACSQDPSRKRRTLGTSVGWSDIYPADYYENWINVTGLAGCFEFVHRADPGNRLFENKEGNNEGSTRVRLPVRGRQPKHC